MWINSFYIGCPNMLLILNNYWLATLLFSNLWCGSAYSRFVLLWCIGIICSCFCTMWRSLQQWCCSLLLWDVVFTFCLTNEFLLGRFFQLSLLFIVWLQRNAFVCFNACNILCTILLICTACIQMGWTDCCSYK